MERTNNDMTATELLEKITFGYNIGNSLESFPIHDRGISSEPVFYETCWGNPPITEKLVLKIKEAGINAIRIPVTWGFNMDAKNRVNPKWFERVRQVVDHVIGNDLFCIINTHHDTNGGWLRASEANYNANSDKFKILWTQIAEYFKHYDSRLIFEGYNEMLDEQRNWCETSTEALETANKYNHLFVDTVRSTGGNNTSRCLVLNTYAAAATDNILSGFKMPVDSVENRLIASIHTYTPYPFCSNEFPDVTECDCNAVRWVLGNLKKYFVDRGIPIIVGEFGCVDKNNHDQRMLYADLFTRIAREYRIKCFWWDNGSGFKMLDRNTLVWKDRDILDTMLHNSF